jgi:hypothetical protein
MIKENHTQRYTNDLLNDFSTYLEAFDCLHLFSGPSVYFHNRTLALLTAYGSAEKAIFATDYMEYLYATLTAWGMHRMGRNNAKLVDFDVFRSSITNLHVQIRGLQNLKLTDLTTSDITDTKNQIWYLIQNLEIGRGAVKIVAGSKALHHILPGLIPPIDREYTLQFFYRNKNINRSEELYFAEIFPLFHQIALSKQTEIHRRLISGGEMDTSLTKVIDNAIIGYVWKNIKNNFSGSPLESESANHNNIHTPLLKQNTTSSTKSPISEQIMLATKELNKQGKIYFTRKEIMGCLDIDTHLITSSYSPIFQGMRDDHPGGAPPVAKRFRGIFHRVEYGKYKLTEYGYSLLSKLFPGEDIIYVE